MQSNLPKWVYLTRSGGKSPTPTLAGEVDKRGPHYVLGRYAYTVYDTSGLLNANVVGYPSVASTNSVYKSSLAYTDLTALETTVNSAKVDEFGVWRNGTNAASAAAWDKYLTNFAEPSAFFQPDWGSRRS